MTNGEFYKEELLKIAHQDGNIALMDNKLIRCGDAATCKTCKFRNKNNCTASMLIWLFEEHKEPYKITLLEKMILEKVYMKSNCKYIARDNDPRNGFDLKFYRRKPSRDNDHWTGGGFIYVPSSIASFSCIKENESEPTKISNILANFEIIEESECVF